MHVIIWCEICAIMKMKGKGEKKIKIKMAQSIETVHTQVVLANKKVLH